MMAAQGSGITSDDLCRHLEQVARTLLGEPNRPLSTRRQLRFERKGSLSIDLARGTYFDHEAGMGGDVLDLIRRATGLTGGDTLSSCWSMALVLPSPSTSARNALRRRQRRPSLLTRPTTLDAYWQRVWDTCRTITAADTAGGYLHQRGCALPPDDGDLRYHPSLKHPSGWTDLALVALITDIENCEPLSLVRTWIDNSRPGKKAPINRPRMIL